MNKRNHEIELVFDSDILTMSQLKEVVRVFEIQAPDDVQIFVSGSPPGNAGGAAGTARFRAQWSYNLEKTTDG